MIIRKSLSLFVCAMFLVVVSGCGSDNSAGSKASGSQSSVQDVLDQGMSAADNARVEVNEEAGPEETVSKETGTEESGTGNKYLENEGSGDGIDVDLTALSSTMVYSEVYNMMYYPEKYIGKTVKMKGMFTMFHDDTTNKNYFGCIVKDATACCAQGIEFELAGDYVYPDDYPAEGNDICVIGTFDTYMEGENTFCTLRNARLDGKS